MLARALAIAVLLAVGMPAAAHAASYVALGDSYSAGEGLGPFEAGTDIDKGAGRNQCHRSRKYAYPRLRKLLLPDITDRLFVACSGATSADMRSVPPQTGSGRQVGQGRQTDAVTGDTRFVTVSAGGNDAGFGELGLGCVQAVIRHSKTVRIGDGTCADHIKASKRKLSAARASLAGLYGDILDRAPGANLVVLGYPRIFPARYRDVPKLDGAAFCVLDHYPVPVTVDVGMPVADAKRLDGFTRDLNGTIREVVDEVRRARPAQAGQLRFANPYGAAVPHNCKGTTPHATVAAAQLSLGRGLSGAKLRDKVKLFIASSTLHPTKEGQRLFARIVQRGFDTPPPPLETDVVRLSPVTDAAAIAPGFTIVESFDNGECMESSLVTVAYRCFTERWVLDPCYAVAEPGTGDGTGVVCPTSPFETDLRRITWATGLGRLGPSEFDEPYGLVLADGQHCRAIQGTHGADVNGRVLDYGCDVQDMVVMRGLHKDRQPWLADIGRQDADFTVRPAGSRAIATAVLLQHQVPPANRPVTDAGGATSDELDVDDRRYHEVDCGRQSTVMDASWEEQIYVTGVPCYEAELIVTEFDHSSQLEPGWSCEYDDAGTVLCRKDGIVDPSDAAGFFSAPHIRAITLW